MTQEPQSIDCRVRKIIAKHLVLDPSAITADKTLYQLRVDDLTKIEIGMDIEFAFDFEATDAEHEACNTVGDLIQLAKRFAGEEVA